MYFSFNNTVKIRPFLCLSIDTEMKKCILVWISTPKPRIISEFKHQCFFKWILFLTLTINSEMNTKLYFSSDIGTKTKSCWKEMKNWSQNEPKASKSDIVI